MSIKTDAAIARLEKEVKSLQDQINEIKSKTPKKSAK